MLLKKSFYLNSHINGIFPLSSHCKKLRTRQVVQLIVVEVYQWFAYVLPWDTSLHIKRWQGQNSTPKKEASTVIWWDEPNWRLPSENPKTSLDLSFSSIKEQDRLNYFSCSCHILSLISIVFFFFFTSCGPEFTGMFGDNGENITNGKFKILKEFPKDYTDIWDLFDSENEENEE